MKIDLSSGIIEGVKQTSSPNFDSRPSGVQPEALIIHSISLPPGQYGGSEIEELFCNKLDCSAHSYFHALKNLKVSAHLLIRRNGEVIQFVSLNERAWHAGESFCLGRENVNDFSIGIELEGCDEDTFEEDQYAALDELIRIVNCRISTNLTVPEYSVTRKLLQKERPTLAPILNGLECGNQSVLEVVVI